jgi:hypothetical protein
MRIALLILTAGIATAPLPGAAAPPTPDEVQKVVDHYNMIWKYDMMATSDVLEKLGKSLRVATLLKECKLEALADTVAPTDDQIDKVIIAYLADKPNGNTMFWEVRAAVKSSLSYYQLGFKNSAAPMQAGMGDGFCKNVTKEADEILRERKGKK